MQRMISLVDLTSGTVVARRSDTRTLDVPADFDPDANAAALDGRSHALYRTVNGKEVSRAVHPRPLSWRAEGEECLVADEGAGGSGAGLYTLCAIERTRG